MYLILVFLLYLIIVLFFFYCRLTVLLKFFADHKSFGIISTAYFVLSILTNYQSLAWVWKCSQSTETCTREASNLADNLYPTLEVCRLVCGTYGPLFPKPTVTTQLSTTYNIFSLSSLEVVLPSNTEQEVNKFLNSTTNLFLQTLSHKDTSKCASQLDLFKIVLAVNSNNLELTWSTNEAYLIEVRTQEKFAVATIVAETVFGIRHGLETLLQLVEFYPTDDKSTCLVSPTAVNIADKPVYPHRGLLLDTARNFLPIALIQKHINGMAASKLNVLHWHITDSQSFPLELESLPNMTKYGAYSSSSIYSPEDITSLVAYAKVRGVRILIEIDAPSHAGNGWQWGPEANLGNLAVCINQQPWRFYCIEPPCGQLNPINPNLYSVLNKLYSELTSRLTDKEAFHMGGDEVFIQCWNSTAEIIEYLGNKSRTQDTFLDLWSDYQQKALNAYDTAVGHQSTTIIVWSSHLTDPTVIEKYLSKSRYIIQTWVPSNDPLPKDLISLGYKIIESTKDAWYLDHGFWGSTVYHDWKTVYENKINVGNSVLGGEVCMWGEFVDGNAIEPRVWPRAAAAAERLWSNPTSSANNAQQRFYRHRERLRTRGIKADAVIPEWCYQNEKACL